MSVGKPRAVNATVDALATADPIASIVGAAARLGIELDADEARRWIDAVRVEEAGGDVSVDVNSGVYGHRISMLDYSPLDLARFREIGRIVGIEDRPPQVVTALAISGSAAQGKIQRFPGDCDFFERVHVRADSREEAGRILGKVIRDKALATLRGDGYRLWEVKWGTHVAPVTYHGKPMKAGSPMRWSPEEVAAGALPVTAADGSTHTIRWEDNVAHPGWCKLDWVVADHVRGAIANASNVLDPTWEAPDGTITPLDGFLDPYFQEVYLETGSIPLFSRLVKQLGADAVDEYVDQLEHEVWKYLVEEPNFGKAARRMYNVFRLTGRYTEAAYLRELFDEPVTALYQIAALIRTLGDAAGSGDAFDPELLVAQTDRLIIAAVAAFDGPDEAEMVSHLTRLRDEFHARSDQGVRLADLGVVQRNAMRAVNAYFERVLRSVPEIAAYMNDIATRAP
jgi:hypothetical protein